MVKKINAIQSTDTSNLVKKADYNTKIGEIEKKIQDHDKYITNQKFNGLMACNYSLKIKGSKISD